MADSNYALSRQLVERALKETSKQLKTRVNLVGSNDFYIVEVKRIKFPETIKNAEAVPMSMLGGETCPLCKK